jgi:hypothetical protein
MALYPFMTIYYSQIFLNIIILFALVSQSSLHENLWGQPSESFRPGLNVTQDMINILSDDSPRKQNHIGFSDSPDNNTTMITKEFVENDTEVSNKEVIMIQSQSILLEDKSIPEGGFIHIYDASPYEISDAHVTAKFPCNEENITDIDILIGKMPNFERLSLDFIPQFSEPGDLCIYQSNLSNVSIPISEIGLFNNSTEDIESAPSTSLVVSIDKLSEPN